MKLAVVGAGVAGMRFAKRVQDEGFAVTLFDKGRVPGGRLASRVHDGLRFEHGVQTIVPEALRFAAEVQRWCEAGVARPCSDGEGEDAFVGAPGMRAIAAHLAAGLEIRSGVAITSIDGGALCAADVDYGAFDYVALALPLPQARVLLEGVTDETAARAFIDAGTYSPCWTLMVAFDRALVLPSPHRDGLFRWAQRQDGTEAERWVFQANAQWTREHLELSKEDAAEQLLAAVRELADADVTFARAHRWRYALVDEAVGVDCYHSERIGLCGDGFVGPNVESAWLSGDALADAFLRAGDGLIHH